jgi:lipoate-protein ligase A
VAGGVVESYRRLSAGLVAGLRALGLVVAQVKTADAKGESAACFDAPSDYEITVGGKKLVGSAQMRRQQMVLQHGSLPLQGDIARIFDFLQVPSAERREELRQELRARATSLELALGRIVPFDEAARHLAAGFAEALNLRLIPGQLSQHEMALAEKLRREKYATREWNSGK